MNGFHLYLLCPPPAIGLLLWGEISQQLHEAHAHSSQNCEYVHPSNVHVPTAKYNAQTLFMSILSGFLPKLLCAGEGGTQLKVYLIGGTPVKQVAEPLIESIKPFFQNEPQPTAVHVKVFPVR